MTGIHFFRADLRLAVLMSTLLGIGVLPAAAVAPQDEIVGEVEFETSCHPAVRAAFNRAVALLHSFEFEDARLGFTEVARADTACAMAHWGIAMTYYHPLWAPPTETEIASSLEALRRARSLPARSREKDYIRAIESFYREHDELEHRARAIRYERSMARVHQRNPDDEEATIFYALAILSNADPADKTYETQRRSGEMLEPLFARMPDHPGLAHYIIHSFDYPALADRAVRAAHRYLEIAPSLPHALHMSAHIFTRLGMWEESIRANALSAEAARIRGRRRAAQELGPGQAQQNELHAIDYLVYAHLQRGDDHAAGELTAYVDALELNWKNSVVAFNAGAVPVRFALERGRWTEAASLPVLEALERADGNYQARTAVALRYWARVVGAARSGDPSRARRDQREVERLAEELASSPSLWARNTSEVFRLQGAAWIALAEGDAPEALERMRAAASLEDRTDKSNLSPGRALPVHEQLGDMLMALARPGEALAEYRESFSRTPRRLRGLLGAARAAVAAGERTAAAQYYRELLELASERSSRQAVGEAEQFFAEQGPTSELSLLPQKRDRR